MAEFIRNEEKVVNVDEPVIFENNTDSDFEVSAGIIFHKSGLYNVSIVGRRTIISKVAERKTGKWIAHGDIPTECPFCGEDWDKYVFGDVWYTDELPKFCPNCGSDMRGEQDGCSNIKGEDKV